MLTIKTYNPCCIAKHFLQQRKIFFFVTAKHIIGIRVHTHNRNTKQMHVLLSSDLLKRFLCFYIKNKFPQHIVCYNTSPYFCISRYTCSLTSGRAYGCLRTMVADLCDPPSTSFSTRACSAPSAHANNSPYSSHENTCVMRWGETRCFIN